jgi:hypothetical protein
MRVKFCRVILIVASSAAAAQPAPPSNDGARPGNIIGTGMSLPRSNAASNLNAATAKSELAPNLPAPPGPQEVRPLLMAARDALLAGRTGEAQEALERAETRALDRSVAIGTENIPARGPVVSGIADARNALATGNSSAAIGHITAAIAAMDATFPAPD